MEVRYEHWIALDGTVSRFVSNDTRCIEWKTSCSKWDSVRRVTALRHSRTICICLKHEQKPISFNKNDVPCRGFSYEVQ